MRQWNTSLLRRKLGEAGLGKIVYTIVISHSFIVLILGAGGTEDEL
jgi:hypothetical protein